MKKLFLLFLIVISCRDLSAQITFHWRQYSGPVTTTIQNPDTSVTLVTGLNKVGIYGYELTVTSEVSGLSGKDSTLVTVISGALDLKQDSVFHPIRPHITKLEIQTAVKGDKIYLLIKSPKPQEMTCIIYDMAGRGLAKSNLKLHQGENYLSLPAPRISGVYVLRFMTYFEVQSREIFL